MSLLTNYDEPVAKALKSEEPFRALCDLASDWIDAGQEPERVIGRFEEELQQSQAAGRQQEEDVLLDVLKVLAGWCGPRRKSGCPFTFPEPHAP
jgi:hypothetical protein